MEFANISALSSLLKECETASVPSHETLPNTSLQTTKIVLPNASIEAGNVKNLIQDKSIWEEHEIPSEDALIDFDDKRPIAKFEILYKHDNVGTEDTFLGMSGKSIASSDCTHLVVKIYFPKSRLDEIDLDCTKNRIKASSKTHKMFTYLPFPVNHLKGVAKFDSKTFILAVTLPIIDEE
jgi:hypothetical protein